ncbi:MAG TPA: hypothetical protein VF796_16020 [Humisphaera sp.]
MRIADLAFMQVCSVLLAGSATCACCWMGLGVFAWLERYGVQGPAWLSVAGLTKVAFGYFGGWIAFVLYGIACGLVRESLPIIGEPDEDSTE